MSRWVCSSSTSKIAMTSAGLLLTGHMAVTRPKDLVSKQRKKEQKHPCVSVVHTDAPPHLFSLLFSDVALYYKISNCPLLALPTHLAYLWRLVRSFLPARDIHIYNSICLPRKLLCRQDKKKYTHQLLSEKLGPRMSWTVRMMGI